MTNLSVLSSRMVFAGVVFWSGCLPASGLNMDVAELSLRLAEEVLQVGNSCKRESCTRFPQILHPRKIILKHSENGVRTSNV